MNRPGAAARGAGGSGIAINDVLIWVLIPALSYLAGALFQAGYDRYFGLPDEIVNADPIATFHAFRRYVDLIAHHAGPATGIPLVFLIALIVLPANYYRLHGVLVLALAAAALVVSFSLRPFVWTLLCAAVLLAVHFSSRNLNEPRFPQLVRTSPLAVKSLALVAFLYATLFAAGNESARFETEFFVTDSGARYVVLAFQDKDAIAARLLDPSCRPVTHLPERLSGYHAARFVKAFTLGDADTPAFRLIETDGLAPNAACGDPPRSPGPWFERLWI